jgi:hypothetical protein
MELVNPASAYVSFYENEEGGEGVGEWSYRGTDAAQAVCEAAMADWAVDAMVAAGWRCLT